MAAQDRSSVEAEAQGWLNEDAELRQRNVWKPVLHEKKSQDNPELGAVVSSYQAAGDPCKWFKIEGRVRTTIEEIRDLLDFRLLERQSEWHHLFVEGEIPEKHARPGEPASDLLELCWMAYDSGSFLVSVRDFIYWKVGKTTDEHGGFQLSYRTVPQSGLNVTIPHRPSYVRGEFQAAHFIEDLGDGMLAYTYIQRADPKGMIPLFLTAGPQAEILLKEIAGVRRATRRSKQASDS